jgi:hypothetical protein
MAVNETEVARLMKLTNSTREEVLDMLECDKRIDRGEKLFELSDDLKAGAKKARQAERKATPVKREKKEDNDKQALVNTMFNAVLPMCDSYEVTNAEREFLFTYNGKKYKVTLACPRS